MKVEEVSFSSYSSNKNRQKMPNNAADFEHNQRVPWNQTNSNRDLRKNFRFKPHSINKQTRTDSRKNMFRVFLSFFYIRFRFTVCVCANTLFWGFFFCFFFSESDFSADLLFYLTLGVFFLNSLSKSVLQSVSSLSLSNWLLSVCPAPVFIQGWSYTF